MRPLLVPHFHPQVVCGISTPFEALSPTNRYVPMHYSPVRHSPPGARSRAAVRLACVKHAASVQSEPGSNSLVEKLFVRPMHKVITGNAINRIALFTSVQVSILVTQSDTHTHRLHSVKDQCLQLEKPCKISRFALQTSLRLQQRGRTIPATPNPVNTSPQHF